jgi:hypothetical protein
MGHSPPPTHCCNRARAQRWWSMRTAGFLARFPTSIAPLDTWVLELSKTP